MGTSNRVCKDCPKDISNLQPQCVRCIKCQKKFRLGRGKAFLEDKKTISEPMGTTDFSQHREKDFDKEVTAIKKEMENLGLR